MRDTKKYPYSDADKKPFKYRCFITFPIPKIGKNGETQVKIKATKIITNANAVMFFQSKPILITHV